MSSEDFIFKLVPQGPSIFPRDLQWFAAEDEGRTEDPTEKKIREAREEGKVAKSADITGAVVLLLPVLTLALLASGIWKGMLDMMRYFLSQAVVLDPVTDGTVITQAFFNYFTSMTLPIVIVALVAAVAANLLQVGFLFTVKPLTPELSKIAPKFGQWLKRSLFSGEAVFNLLKSLIKVVVIIAIAYINIQGEMHKIIHLIHVPFLQGVDLLAKMGLSIVIQTAVVLLVLSIPDYLYQRHVHKESLKMTKQEIKEEFKQTEGDPLIKSRLRERMRQILRSNMMKNVPKADVVITNPTHFAIALEFDRSTMEAPQVIAKGQDLIALKIRELAKEHQVPVVENKPLARALYASVEIGDMVPMEYWEVVARILGEIGYLERRARKVV